ncbi:MAG: D-3-phosphoglycerate dehydrogenase / 2-oxoglutarate reductase [Gaiellales bacterium]|jgi:D-3-phosphoglycerate dehydrogenase|nr:D-3-phosphoglycerate dehydrogenase / 2-oxoglutarate reductase [Gaiellales bacterium]
MSKPVCLIAEPIADSGLELLRGACEVLEVEPGADLTAALAEAEALVVRSATKVDAALIASAPKLRVIGRAGVGVDNVDVSAATAAGIVVCNAPEANVVSAAEHALALMLSLARNVSVAERSLRQGGWERERFAGIELEGKTLSLLGFGRIGRLVAARARALGMHIVAYDPYVTAERMAELGVESAETVEAALAAADVVSLHLPVTEATRRLIDATRLGLLRPGALLVNAARGALVDEAALVAALESGRLGGAALDVFAKEPLAADSPLREAPNLVLTPHLAGSTHEAQDRAGVVVAEQVVAALAGQSVAHALNLPFVPEDERRVLEPFLPVAERLGRLAMALAEGPVTRIEIATAGRLASTGSRLLTSAALRGAFGSAHESLNDVNALSVAAELGVEVAEQHRSGASDYTNLLAVTVRDPQERTVTGTVLGADHKPWLVRVHGLPLEIELSGRLLLLRNDDVPGMVGRVGTLLGDAGVNIANMTLSRSSAGGDAMMAFALDDDPRPAIMATLATLPGVLATPLFVRLS